MIHYHNVSRSEDVAGRPLSASRATRDASPRQPLISAELTCHGRIIKHNTSVDPCADTDSDDVPSDGEAQMTQPLLGNVRANFHSACLDSEMSGASVTSAAPARGAVQMVRIISVRLLILILLFVVN